ncbi:MAG: SsrA-binding protein SmpB [Candidatus Zixiibacteriota bacterium]
MEQKEYKEKNIVTNRKAFRDYEIIEKREAGIELKGYEVKSLREGRVNLADSYAAIKDGELFLFHLHISPYKFTADAQYNPVRPRRLLLHKKEIRRLISATAEKGFTLVPLRIYFKGPRVKIELGTARGRKKYDKREQIAKKEADRSIERAHRRSMKE